LLDIISQIENPKTTPPCPISPNITPNRKGKMGIAKRAGFIY
jgi:hypothetical protein